MNEYLNELSKVLGRTIKTSHLEKIGFWINVYNGLHDSSLDRYFTPHKKIKNEYVQAQECKSFSRKRFKYNAQIKACKAWSGLMFNEYTDFKSFDKAEIDNSKEIGYLQEFFENTGLWGTLDAKFIDMFGVGTVAAVIEMSNQYGIIPQFYNADAIFPLKVIGGKIRDVALYSTTEVNGKKYHLFNIHQEILAKGITIDKRQEVSKVALTPSTKNSYQIKYFAFDEQKKPVDVKTVLGLEPEYISKQRLFSIFKPFNKHVKGFDNSLGAPVFCDDIDAIREIDEIYDTKQLDLRSSRRHIFLDYQLLSNVPLPQAVAEIATFISRDKMSIGENNSFVKEFAPTPNMDKYNADLANAIIRFSKAVGLGTDEFKEDIKGFATATQVISENQEKFKNLKKHYSSISGEFINFCKGILYCACEVYKEDLNYNANIGLFIQDSVIEDDATKRSNALQEVSDGVRSIESYLIEFRGLTGEALEAELEAIKKGKSIDWQAEIERFNINKTTDNNSANDEDNSTTDEG